MVDDYFGIFLEKKARVHFEASTLSPPLGFNATLPPVSTFECHLMSSGRGRWKGRTPTAALAARAAQLKRNASPQEAPTYSNVLATLNSKPKTELSFDKLDTPLLLRVQKDLKFLINECNRALKVVDTEFQAVKRIYNIVQGNQHKQQQANVEITEPPLKKARTSPDIEDTAVIKHESEGEKGIDQEMVDANATPVDHGEEILEKEEVEKGQDGDGSQTSFKDEEAIKKKGFEKNPKSEFVKPQTLPVAALSLFEDTIEGLPQTGEKYLKKKYGVASYPARDLKDLLPGEIPDQDFTKAKPANQVQFSTFATAIEPYFRDYTEEDLSFLKQKSVGATELNYSRPTTLSPYLIPPLGRVYTDTWTESDGPNAGYSISPAPSNNTNTNHFRPIGSSDILSDDILETDDISCGPLVSRLLSAIMNDNSEEDESVAGNIKTESNSEDKDDDTAKTAATNSSISTGFIEPSWKIGTLKADYGSLEERLKREFRYVGILDVNLLKNEQKKRQQFKNAIVNGVHNGSAGNSNDVDDDLEIDWLTGQEDDEICYELRELQKKLKQATKFNQAAKKRLLPLVEEQMAYQEYSRILDDLDRQVDQAYLKRIRNPRSKKKKSGAGAVSSTSSLVAAGANQVTVEQKPSLRALLDKRLRWIEKVGPVFKPPEIMKRMPGETVLKDLQLDDEEDEYAGDEDEEVPYGISM